MKNLLLVTIAALLAVGCGPAKDDVCEPSSTQSCVGDGPCVGTQTCASDGTSFGTCVCVAADSSAPDRAAPTADGSSPDGEVTPDDAGEPDALVEMDATLADAAEDSATDATSPDATVPDATQPDAAQPDASLEAGAGASGELCLACGANEKFCAGLCVSNNKPQYGCGGDSCAACPSVAHTVPGCDPQGACTVASCEAGWADCDKNPTNGCEANLSAAATCGSCDVACTGTDNLCSPSGCVAACTPPLSLCGGNRCVNLATAESDCGSCGRTCEAQEHGFGGLCNGGTCGTTPQCFPGFSNCDGDCVDLTSDYWTCGSCTNHCSFATNAVSACSNSTCVSTCEPGWNACGNACINAQSDTSHCGTCGHACGAGEACLAGECRPASSLWLATGRAAPNDIVADATHVYWSEANGGTIQRVLKSGGSVQTIAQDQARPTRIAVDGQYVYWSANLGGAIMRAPKDGSGIPQIVVATTSPSAFVIVGDTLYFLSGVNVQQVNKAGGSASTFQQIGGGVVNTLELLTEGTALFVGAVSNTGTYAVLRLPIAGGGITTTTVQTNSITPMAIDAGNVYYKMGFNVPRVGWINASNPSQTGIIETWDPNGGGRRSLPYALTGAACGLIWSGEGRLLLSRLNSTRSSTLAITAATRVIHDESYLYWLDSTGNVGKLAMP